VLLLRSLVSALAVSLTVSLTVAIAVALGLAGLPQASAADAGPDPSYAPLDRPGPALSVAPGDLQGAMQCHGTPGEGPRAVFLNPATSVTPEENYSWNWMKVFNAQGRYWCTTTMPHHTFGDIQTASEYIVHAIRTMYRRTGGKVAIMGHSQGGMSGRWALRFWPDLRSKVSEVIGMAPSNHGTRSLVQCIEGVTTCTPAVWQQGAGSAFMDALNSRAETFADIDYTNVYTMLDEVVTPPASSGLTTGAGRIANVRVQDVCPADPHEHVLMGTASPAVYAIVMDALGHAGPAQVARVDRAYCNRLYMPGVDPIAVHEYAPMLSAIPSLLTTVTPDVTLSGAPLLRREPALRCYVYAAGCP